MPRRLAVAALLVSLLLAACGSSDEPTVGAGPAPAASAGSMPADGAGMGGMGGDVTCEPSGTSLAVTAKDIKWNTDCLAVPAGQAFSIAVDNTDAVAHNLAILAAHSSTDVLFRGELIPGPEKTTYQVPALPAGSYVFHCEVHPTAMRGTFIVM